MSSEVFAYSLELSLISLLKRERLIVIVTLLSLFLSFPYHINLSLTYTFKKLFPDFLLLFHKFFGTTFLCLVTSLLKLHNKLSGCAFLNFRLLLLPVRHLKTYLPSGHSRFFLIPRSPYSS